VQKVDTFLTTVVASVVVAVVGAIAAFYLGGVREKRKRILARQAEEQIRLEQWRREEQRRIEERKQREHQREEERKQRIIDRRAEALDDIRLQALPSIEVACAVLQYQHSVWRLMATHDIAVIGASAGGVEALIRLAGDLPQDLPMAVFAVVHYPEETPSVLPRLLDRAGPLGAKTLRRVLLGSPLPEEQTSAPSDLE
jgi:chemotaxis response regulator CheB